MRKNKKQRRIMLLLILILSITIGFALLSTTLKINGSASIKSNTWGIHWDDTSVNVATGSVEANLPVVSKTTSDDDTVSFNVELDLPGDFYEFSVDAVNEGSIDGALELEENFITYKVEDQETTLPEYMDFKVTYDDDTNPTTGDVLKASKSKTYKIRVEFKSSVEELPENPEPLTIEVNLPYVQHKTENSSSPWILPTGKTKDNLEVGDEICINTECFNFLHYDGNDIVMLAKYNLKLGDIYDNRWNKIGEHTSNDSGYGLQSSEAKGFVNGASVWDGTVIFSPINYWYDGSGLDPKYGTSYPADIYDPISYNGAPGESNYSIVYYVDAYKDVLSSYGAIIKDSRLLTYSEATDSSIGCDGDVFVRKCPTDGFITNTSFWLGSAYDDNYIWFVYNDGTFQYSNTECIYSFGVRPVIVISKSTIN